MVRHRKAPVITRFPRLIETKMPRKHLTDIVCQTIAADKQTRYWDTTMRGFGITVGPRSKTFMVMAGANRQLITLGKYPETPLAKARRDAHRILGTHVATDIITFADARADFIELHCLRKNRPSTARSSAWLLNRVSFSAPLDRITRRDIQHAIRDMSPSTANHTLAALKTLFNWCVDHGMLTTTPLLRARMPHASVSRDRVLTDAELNSIWNAAADMGTFETIVKLLMLSGLRRNEVASLQHGYVKSDTLILPKTLTKNKREHVLPLGATAAALLKPIIDGFEGASPQALIFPVPGVDTVFSGWSKSKTRLDKESKVTGWTLHDLRRTFATIHAKLKTPPHIIEALLNHASGQISGVAAVYNRYQYEDEKRVAMLAYDRYVTALILPK